MQKLLPRMTRIPIRQFRDDLQSVDIEFPYEVEFSFSKFVGKLKEQYNNDSSPVLKAILETFDEAEHLISCDGHLACSVLKSEIVNILMPSLIYKSEKAFVSQPFSYSFKSATKTLEDFMNDEDWHIEVDREIIDPDRMIINAGVYILQECYGIEGLDLFYEQMKYYNTKTNQVKYEEIAFKIDFVEIENTKPLLPLTQEQITQLLENVEDTGMWLEYLPPDRFKIKGFILGQLHDVTKVNIHSVMRQEIANVGDRSEPSVVINRINNLFRSYLEDKDLHVGLANLKYVDLLNDQSTSISLTKVLDVRKFMNEDGYDPNCSYCQSIVDRHIVIQEDLESKVNLSRPERLLMDNGIKSFIVLPILDDDGQVMSVMELGSTRPLGVNSITLIKLEEMVHLLKLMIQNFSKEIDKEVALIIRNNFTNIHPSVEWKFKEVATKFHLNRIGEGEPADIDPIKFENVYPLYGQADVVSSSKLRTKALKSDLDSNLRSLNALLDGWLEKKKLFLLQNYRSKVQNYITKLNNDFSASDESSIIDFLHNVVHPHLEELKHRHTELNDNAYNKYVNELDKDLKIVYKERKLYDDSVNHLNIELSKFFQREDDEMQKTLPHFFEKYKTDGVEYNLYLGQSLLNGGNFSNNDLKEFKIWQLRNMLEATQLVKDISPTLPVPIETAQLIFVYSNDLNIQFRMEEKKFDVDGSYNVRYEILKKRIDKATIKGSEERLTLANKIAIVYLHEKDRREYEEYISYLQDEGLVSPDVEYLELNKLPGADGLKAIRLSLP